MARCFLNVQVIYKNTLCCFRTQVKIHCRFCSSTKLRTKHQVKLSYFCPVFRTCIRICNFQFFNQRFHICQIFIFKRFCQTGQNCFLLLSVLYYSWVCSFKLSFIKSFAETFCRFIYLFLSFIF